MAKSLTPKTDPDRPDLPELSERLPELVQMLDRAAACLAALPTGASYLVIWDQLYAKAHAIKGLSRLLASPPGLATELAALSDTLGFAYMGKFAVRDPERSAKILGKIARALEAKEGIERLTAELSASYTEELGHAERAPLVPSTLHYLSEFVSKKAYEAVRLGLAHWMVEEPMPLSEYIAWSQRFTAAVQPENGKHGIVIHCAPQLQSGDSAMIHAVGWGSSPIPADVSLGERLAAAFPKAQLTRRG